MYLKPIRTRKVYEEIVDQIRSLITSGALKPGDKLPPERELADTLKVSRASVREALTVLESRGIIESRPGGGTFIRESTVESFAEPFALMLMQSRTSSFALLELRTILESEAAALAAKRASPEDIERMMEYVGQMEADVAAGGLGDHADFDFHLSIAEATKNAMLVRVMAGISDVFAQSLRTSRLRLFTLPGGSKTLLDQHVEIAQRIAERDARGAKRAMRNHLLYVRDKLQEFERGEKTEASEAKQAENVLRREQGE
ncbi:MAG: FadR family transcriptional regulator [Firmicutes bacterium]|jgi:GntR family transcriptional repressor for pyruvate dehydrogenase complex|nr:FadR family transcriptional regulator [Bacillota bacterium]